MFFRNLTFFRFTPAPQPEFSTQAVWEMLALQQSLSECALKPVGVLELSSRGFVAPYGSGDDRLAVRHGDCIWITVGGEDKILPASAVNAALAKKLAAIEQTEGRRLGGRARKQLKDDLIHEMLPRALVRPSRIDAYLDLKRGLVVVNSASRKVAESVVSELRHALGSFPALPLNAENAPRSTMTGWLAGEQMPEHLSLGDCATLKDAAERGANVRLQRQELQGDEVAHHLQAGKQAARLGLYYEGGIGFTLDEDLVLRRVDYGDELIQSLESNEREDIAAELDARFVLMSGALGGLFDVLEKALRLSKAEG